MQKRILTEPFLKALKPAAQRYAVSDALVPGLRVSVTPKGVKSFILWRRVDPRAKSASALSLGRVGELTLAQARDKVRSWLAQIAAGQDPRHAERASRDATFAAVMENYLATHVKHQRKFKDTAREMRKELLPRFGGRPLSNIARRDVIRMIDELKARAPSQARNVFGHMRAPCNWAIAKDLLQTSPCDHVRLTRLLGPKLPRQRVLTDAEIIVLWRAAEELGYPYGALVRMLLFTGQRKNEVARAVWSEFDLVNRSWTIPRARFKSDVAHVVPLADATMELLQSLPRWAGSDYVFSTNGRRPFTGFSLAKRALDAAMGDVEPFVLHDLRRTMRTRLSELAIADNVAELAVGHARRGLATIYDQHKYRAELRAAFAAWAQRLQAIVAPPPTARILRLPKTSWLVL